MSSPSVPPPSAPPAPRRSRAVAWLLLLLLLAVAAAVGWHYWRARETGDQAALADAQLRLDALDARIDGLRRDQRAQHARLQQVDATNRVLRDEVLGVGERAALLEDSVGKLADPERHGAQALRLDEAELLLTMAQQRLRVAGDLESAQRSYALAAGVLAGVDDPAYLSLRQSLAQERAALDAVQAEPRARVLAQLAAFANDLGRPPAAASPAPGGQPWWRRVLASVVDVRPSDRAVAVQPADRHAAEAGLQLELSLARAAAERRDAAGLQAALARADAWLRRLWPASPALEQRRARLRTIAAMPLSLALPTLGSTLQQLRQLRASRQHAR